MGVRYDAAIPETLNDTFDPLWQRFQEALREHESVWAEALIAQCLGRDDFRRVWIASEFVANSCIRYPQLLADLFAQGALDQPSNARALVQRIEDQLADIDNHADPENELHRRLRQIRRREMVRLAWRDLSGLCDLDETMEELSALADGCVQQALRFHHGWLKHRFGVPTGELNNQPAQMVVLGLGKLGGRELNYSSDIDLIFAYDESGQTECDEASQKTISNQEFFIKLGRRIIAALDPVTPDGFVFRTDMRLRPNGESGPLVLSFSAMEHYYQTHGRDWERYALIKARLVAGNSKAGAELAAILKPFIYRKYLDFGAFDSIREMKGMIRRELQKKGIDDDLKLGWGGIREVEFLIQSHQLIRGGRETALQTSSLYQAMSALVQRGVIDAEGQQDLLQGYRFLRNSEHRLQMFADRQTQRLPDSDLDKNRLAWSMGCADWVEYMAQLDNHRDAIHQQFKSILESPSNEQEAGGSERSLERILSDVWSGLTDEDTVTAGLAQAGFLNPQSTLGLLKGFREGRLYQMFSGVDRDRVDRLMPLALKQALQHSESERAVAAFISVVESIGRRSVYLSLLIENPLALKQLIHLCAASPWISRYIGQHPVIMDELLDPIDDIRLQCVEQIQQMLTNRLSQIEENDEESQLNMLREFHHGHVLRVAAADIVGKLEVDDVHHALSCLAEVLLNETFNQAISVTRRKYEQGNTVSGIVAYGKFASNELGYHSDLDVVVCFENRAPGDLKESGVQAHSSEAEYFYSRVSRRLIHLLTTRTHAGTLYELDMRLRPSGRSGTLVASLTGFLDYQLKSAWTWEHQALVRARVVVGEDDFRQEFEQVRAQILCLKREDETLRDDVLTMRKKMIDANCQSTDTHYDIKLDQGGIVDIEFLLQYWVLGNAHDIPALTLPRTTADTIEALITHKVISEDTGAAISQAYRAYMRQSLDLKLMDIPVLVPQDVLGDERAAIKSIWNNTFG